MCEGLFSGWIWTLLVEVMHSMDIWEGKGHTSSFIPIRLLLTFMSIYKTTLA